MVADFKSNQQAGLTGLYKGTEISEEASKDDRQLELLSFDSYNTSAQASEDDRQRLGQPVDIKEIFPGMAYIQALAKKVRCQIFDFFRRTLRSIIEIGNYLKEIESEVKSFFGSEEGKARFKQWLESPSGVGSPEVALSMIEITSWYNDLKPEMQRLVINKTQKWSFSALKRLRGLSNELIKQLIKEEKQTAKSIERAIATSLASELAPLPAEEDRPVTSSDWSNLRKGFNLLPKHIKVLKQKAENLASLEAETPPVVKVSHVNEAIAQCKEDPELLSKPPAKKAKKNKINTSTPAESPLQDNSDEAITELIASAIADDMEKEQAANSRTIALLQQAIAEKDAAIAAQEKQINSAIAGELEKAARVHQEQMESLRQTLGVQSPPFDCAQGPPVEGMYTQEQLDEAVEKKIADAYKNMYTDEEVQEEIEFELRKERIEHQKEFDAKIAEARAEILESADTTYAAKLASLEQALAEKERAIASLEEQQATAETPKVASLQKELAEKDRAIASLEELQAAAETEKIASLQKELAEKERAIASMSEQTEAAVAQARADEREKTASAMASQIASLQQTLAELQQTLAEKDRAIASLKEQQATTETEKVTSLQKELVEKDKAIASLEEQTAAAVTQARTEEKKKIEQAMASRLKSLQQALASSSEEKAAAVAEARADEQTLAWGDIRALQEEVKMLKAENHSLQTTKEQLATACGQVEELKSQLTDSENKYKEKVRWLENDFNQVTKINIDNGKAIKLLESANQSMNQENRSLKEELASYKNIEKKIQLNYHKINQAENLKVENAKLVESLESARENLQGQINQSVSLASSVTQLNRIVDEILFLQQTLAKQGIPGCKKESYVSPQDGQEYQGVKGVVKLIQDLVSNNNFNLKTT